LSSTYSPLYSEPPQPLFQTYYHEVFPPLRRSHRQKQSPFVVFGFQSGTPRITLTAGPTNESTSHDCSLRLHLGVGFPPPCIALGYDAFVAAGFIFFFFLECLLGQFSSFPTSGAVNPPMPEIPTNFFFPPHRPSNVWRQLDSLGDVRHQVCPKASGFFFLQRWSSLFYQNSFTHAFCSFR